MTPALDVRALPVVAMVVLLANSASSAPLDPQQSTAASGNCAQIGYLSLEAQAETTPAKDKVRGRNRVNEKLAIPVFAGAGCGGLILINTAPTAPENRTEPKADRTEELSNRVETLVQTWGRNDEKIANLIQLMMLGVLALTVALGVGVFWTVRVLQDYMKQWATHHLMHSFVETQSVTSNANAHFVSALEAFSSRQLGNKIEQLRESTRNGVTPTLDQVLEAVVELTVYPVGLRDDIQAIAYRLEPVPRQIQRIYSLWAEVKSEAIDVRTAHRLVVALIPLVEAKPDSARVAKALAAFAQQLAAAPSGSNSLPDEPGF